MAALDLKSRILDCHLYFFREGDAFTLPEAGTAGVAALPNANDTAWLDLGSIEDWEDTVDGGNDLEAWTPVAGVLQLKDIIEIKPKFTLKATTNDMTALAYESFYRSNNDLSSLSGQFNPMFGALRKGWLHAQRYDQDGTLNFSFDLWCRLKMTSGVKGGDLLRPSWEAVVLHSTLNTAEISQS